jgi:predicted DNA-binding transcriptional regulator AlpA
MEKLLSKREAGALVGIHPESIMRLAREGKFPKPIRLGSSQRCRVRFIAGEVDRWQSERMAERQAA